MAESGVRTDLATRSSGRPEQWPVEVWWNLDAIRQFGADHVMEVAKLAAERTGDGAISFGIGGDEVGGPASGSRKSIGSPATRDCG